MEAADKETLRNEALAIVRAALEDSGERLDEADWEFIDAVLAPTAALLNGEFGDEEWYERMVSCYRQFA